MVIPGRLTVIMRVDVNKPGSDDLAFGINGSLALAVMAGSMAAIFRLGWRYLLDRVRCLCRRKLAVLDDNIVVLHLSPSVNFCDPSALL